MKKTGEFLKAKRQLHGLTLRDLEKKAHVSNSQISKIERGKYTPTLDVLARLLSALEVSWVEFLTATGYIKPGEEIYKVKESEPFALHEDTGKYKPRKGR